MVKPKLFNSVQSSILSAAFVIAVSFGISALLGLIKTRLLATYYGDDPILGVFYTADRIPSLIYTILVAGTLSSIFIPVFASEIKKDKKKAFEMASNLLNICLALFVVSGTLVALLAPNIIRVLSSNLFSDAEILIASNLMRILILGQLILLISSFFTSVLQSFRHFLVPAMAPILYNLGIIIGILFLVPSMGIYGVAVGSIIGACLHLVIQLPTISTVKFAYSFKLNRKDVLSMDALKIAPPRIISSAVSQLSLVAYNSLAILISTSSVIYLKFADQLQSLPVNLFGSSIALAALPALSFETDEKDMQKFKKTFLNSLFQIVFLSVPAAVILLILRVPAVRLAYGASKFPWDATLATATTLGFFAIAILPQSASMLITKAFFALKDTKTPLITGTISVVIGLVGSYFCVKYLQAEAWVLGAGIAVASILDFLLLLALLSKKIGGFGKHAIFKPFAKIALSAVAMSSSLYLPMKILDIRILDTTKTANLILLTCVVISAGMVSYLFFTWLFKVKEIELFYKIVKRLRIKTALTPQTPISPDPEDVI